MSTPVGSIHYDLKLDTSKFDSAIKKVGHDLAGIGKAMAVGIGVAGAAVTAFGVSAVKSFQDSEAVGAQLNAVLKSTGGVAGVTAEQASALATSLQSVTRFSDETIQTGENMLLTFTNIGKDIFPNATETMLDMSQALGQDVKASAIQLGKALNDPINGITALRRVGVNFTDKQQEMIEKLVKSGKTMEAQKIILAELKTEFGGSARAAGDTFAGKMDILKNSFDDVKESIGKTIVGAITPLATKLSTFLASEQFTKWLAKLQEWLAVWLPKAFNYLTTVLIPALWNIIKAVYPVFEALGKAIISIITWLADNTWVIWALVGAFAAWKTAMLITHTIQAIGDSFKLMADASKTAINGAKKVFDGLASAVTSPITMPAIAVAAAIAAIYLVIDAYKKLQEENKKAASATENAVKAEQDFVNSLNKARDSGKITQAEYQRRRDAFFGKKALGGTVQANKPYMVGERGREMFVPNQSGTIIPNNTIRKMEEQKPTGSTTHVSINGDIILQDKSAVDRFFEKLNRNSELARKGMATL